MANPLSERSADKRESGFQRSAAGGLVVSTAEAAIQAHNQQLALRTHDLLSLPIAVLTEQRDNALRLLASAREDAEEELRQLAAEQDEFITFLINDHEHKLAEVRRELELTRSQLSRPKVPGAVMPNQARPIQPDTVAGHPDAVAVDGTLPQLDELRQALDAAIGEIEETRTDATRLQEERDEAIRAIDDARVELMNQVEVARDENFQLETRLDELNRLLDDARDQARDEASRFNEELGELRRLLDEREDEVRRLRARLAKHVTEVKPSRPPPLPGAGQQQERTPREDRELRPPLLEAKQELGSTAGTATFRARAPAAVNPARPIAPKPTAPKLTAPKLTAPKPAAPKPALRRLDVAGASGGIVTPIGSVPPKRDN